MTVALDYRDNLLMALQWLRQKSLIQVAATCMMIFAAHPVMASCGDYLFRAGKPVTGHEMYVDSTVHHQAELILPAASDQPVAGPLNIPRRPCSGPNCSQSRIPLVPVPGVPSIVFRGLDPAALLESACLLAETRVAIEFPESERGAHYVPSTIFRPPAA